MILEIAAGILLGFLLLCALPVLLVGVLIALQKVLGVLEAILPWAALIALAFGAFKFGQWMYDDWPESMGICIWTTALGIAVYAPIFIVLNGGKAWRAFWARRRASKERPIC